MMCPCTLWYWKAVVFSEVGPSVVTPSEWSAAAWDNAWIRRGGWKFSLPCNSVVLIEPTRLLPRVLSMRNARDCSLEIYLGTCDPRHPHRLAMLAVCCRELFVPQFLGIGRGISSLMAGRFWMLGTSGEARMDEQLFTSTIQDKGLGWGPPRAPPNKSEEDIFGNMRDGIWYAKSDCIRRGNGTLNPLAGWVEICPVVLGFTCNSFRKVLWLQSYSYGLSIN